MIYTYTSKLYMHVYIVVVYNYFFTFKSTQK